MYRWLLTLLLCLATALPVSAAPTLRALNVHQGAPNWFTADEAWMGLGLDSTGRVYASFSSFLTPDATGDVGIVRYTPSTDTMEWLTSFSAIAAAAGNLHEGERFAKQHVDFVGWNNKLYFASHDFHDATRQNEVRGSHLFVYDPTANTFDDLSRGMPNGVAIAQQGIIGMDIVSSTGMLIGITYPVGNLVRIPLASATPTPSVSAPAVSGQQVTRKVLATTRRGGTGYVSYYPDTPDPTPLFAIAATTGAVRTTANRVAYGIMQGRVKTRDGATAYLLDEVGRLYRLTVATEVLTDLGYLYGQEGFDLYGQSDGLALSNDEKYLFTWVSSWQHNHGKLFSYEIATGTRTEEASFADPDRKWDRRTTALTIDQAGNLYVLDHAPSHIGEGRLLQISGVAHSPALSRTTGR